MRQRLPLRIDFYVRQRGLLLSSQAPLRQPPATDPGWVCTEEAVRTQSRVIVLGTSMAKFLKTLGVYTTSGETQTRLRNQMKRLFGYSG